MSTNTPQIMAQSLPHDASNIRKPIPSLHRHYTTGLPETGTVDEFRRASTTSAFENPLSNTTSLLQTAPKRFSLPYTPPRSVSPTAAAFSAGFADTKSSAKRVSLSRAMTGLTRRLTNVRRKSRSPDQKDAEPPPCHPTGLSQTPPSPVSPTSAAFHTTPSNGSDSDEHAVADGQADHSKTTQTQQRKHRFSTGDHFRRVTEFAVAHQPLRHKRSDGKTNGSKRLHALDALFRREVTRDTTQAVVPVGVGNKARRLSLSLPNDFVIAVEPLTKNYEVKTTFGRFDKFATGGTSSLGKVTLRQAVGEVYAVKLFRPKHSKETQSDYDAKVKSEFSIAKSLHHPNIIESIALCTYHNRWAYVMEYCEVGDLHDLSELKYLRSPERVADRACLAKQLIQGVAFLHRNGIAHRDLKLENLLLTTDSKLKITDFGVSDVFSGVHPGLREAGGQCGVGVNDQEIKLCKPGLTGTPSFMSPEVFAQKDCYDPRAADVWSIAICVYAIGTGSIVWTTPTEDQAGFKYLMDRWRKLFDDHGENFDASVESVCLPPLFNRESFPSPAFRRLMWRMLHPNPRLRITSAQLVKSKWCERTPCCQPESYDMVCNVDATKVSSISQPHLVIHNHRPPVKPLLGNPSLGKMPGQVGY